MQRYVTKNLPCDDKYFLRYADIAKKHYDYFRKYSTTDDGDEISCYEFGAGWELINPVCMNLIGVKSIQCIDIRKLVLPYLLNDMVSKLYRLNEKFTFECSLPDKVPEISLSNYKNVLRDYFGIEYSAPVDARNTFFENSAFDLIVSNVTLEHIPKEDILKILQECYRMLKPGGIFSACIDYKDHWSYSDGDITVYEFLKYSPSQWKKYNPSLHYQNRLRHKDYIEMIGDTDFKIIEEDITAPSNESIETIKSMKIHDGFLNKYTLDELAITGSWIVLQK